MMSLPDVDEGPAKTNVPTYDSYTPAATALEQVKGTDDEGCPESVGGAIGLEESGQGSDLASAPLSSPPHAENSSTTARS
jgi:hypothetical protein